VHICIISVNFSKIDRFPDRGITIIAPGCCISTTWGKIYPPLLPLPQTPATPVFGGGVPYYIINPR